MSYRELAPPPPLASHVACLWWRTGAPPRILPDGCADLVWTGAALIVAGPATCAVVPRLPADEPKLGVRFRVGAAGVALGLPAGELLDRSAPLGEIWADGAELEERVAAATDTRARFEVLARAVAARLAHAPDPDPLVRAAVLDLGRPRTPIARLCERLAISERQLRRRFEGAVGYPPRTLARVLRLQRFLALAAADGGELARLGVEAGYADQPHLTRDCAALAGLPAGALAGRLGDRVAMLVAGSMATLGFLVCALARNTTTLALAITALGG
ncbi:MAG: helix-turn-helix domain-containing protein, partial [Solirubrobacterales bacterium]|nr:helix-turn-helix domain-containing protein [Solirubrobacterales bacterium]